MGSQFKTLLRWLLRPVLRYRGDPGQMYLTFDDGPHPEVTPRILDTLDQCGVKATFFMIGQEMERYPAIVEQVLDRGHAVALHGFTHRHGPDMSWREQLDDLRRMRAVAQRFGVVLRSYRPAYGDLSVLRIVWCALHRVRIVMWSFESRDSFVKSETELADRVTPQALSAGDILLFHDDTPVTAQALPGLLQRAQGAGLRFGTLESA
ncbi:MAG: polysaccharide deacetylase family protein [Rhizobacter sp.]